MKAAAVSRCRHAGIAVVIAAALGIQLVLIGTGGAGANSKPVGAAVTTYAFADSSSL